jgi:hypothetical protein
MSVRAISIRRPWPWAIFNLPEWLAKDIENRSSDYRRQREQLLDRNRITTTAATHR